MLSYVGLAVLILVLLEIPLGVLAARHERDLTAAQAERLAAGLAVVAGEDLETGRTGDLSATVRRYQAQTGGVVDVVDTADRLVAASEASSDSDVLSDQERLVEAALSGRPAGSFGTDAGVPWAHAAVPISTDGGQAGGAVLLGIPAMSTENRIHDVWLALAGFGVGLVAITALVGVLLARSLTRPLGRLGATVTDFADGRLEVRALKEDGPHEVRALADQFNHMAGRITELIDVHSRFVADASHQLRSPLTALRLRLENLEAVASGSSADGIAAATREVQRLSRIVDGLLTLGRAEEKAVPRQAVDVAQVIEERCDAWSALSNERHVALVIEPAPVPPARVVLVPGDLDQILDNLLANAMDASSEGGRIRVSLKQPPNDRLELHVVDTGAGMDAADRSRAFDRFWQGSGVNGGHSGLGLAIVWQLAVRNQATVELRPSDPVGIDAVVTFADP